ncbi:MAG TPA: 3-deoxy-8-phosphooctulonate synthase, partial [Parvibaculum sp.]
MPANAIVKIGKLEIANDKPFTLIAGPCQLETRQHAFDMAGAIKEIADRLGIGFIYKTSFDKANRTSRNAKRGLGLELALPIFEDLRKEFGVPVLTDVHEREQCAELANSVDVLQIPAFLCRQTDLLEAAAQTGLVVNVKKGQ